MITNSTTGAYAGRRVAITGASGYIGSALRAWLRAARAQLLLVSRRPVDGVSDERWLEGDVSTAGCWQRVVAEADVVFHLAGNTSVYAAAADPAGSVVSTVLPVAQLCRAVRDRQRQVHVVFASTATIYGLTPDLPVVEDAPQLPITVYDQHKLFAERELALASRHRLLSSVSLRLANVYGPSPGTSSSDDRGILNRVTRLALNGSEVRAFGGGNYLRDYVYIGDVVDAFVRAGLALECAGESFNVGSGRGVTVRDAFALAIERAHAATGRRSSLVSADWPAGADPIEFRNYTADVRRLADACGWRPQVTLADGIDRLITAFAAQPSVSR